MSNDRIDVIFELFNGKLVTFYQLIEYNGEFWFECFDESCHTMFIKSDEIANHSYNFI